MTVHKIDPDVLGLTRVALLGQAFGDVLRTTVEFHNAIAANSRYLQRYDVGIPQVQAAPNFLVSHGGNCISALQARKQNSPISG